MDFGKPLQKRKSEIKYEAFDFSEIQLQSFTVDKLSCFQFEHLYMCSIQLVTLVQFEILKWGFVLCPAVLTSSRIFFWKQILLHKFGRDTFTHLTDIIIIQIFISIPVSELEAQQGIIFSRNKKRQNHITKSLTSWINSLCLAVYLVRLLVSDQDNCHWHKIGRNDILWQKFPH